MRQTERHFIDSSVFLSVLLSPKTRIEKEQQRYALRYFKRLKSGLFNGHITFTVYSEVLYIIMSKIDKLAWIDAITQFLNIVGENNIKTEVLSGVKIYKNYARISNLESKIGTIDTLLLSESITLKIPYFITFDEDIGEYVSDNKTEERLIRIKQLDYSFFEKE